MNKPKVVFTDRTVCWIVWLLRIIVGGTFVFSGFAKVVDPWGFLFKLQEYLSAWHMDWMPNEALVAIAISWAATEFTLGVLLILGCWRRLASHAAFCIMCAMLILTLYIVIAAPVDDCGCFGDALVLSNTATFIKNIILTALAGLLMVYNQRIKGLYHYLTQWIVVVGSIVYCLILSVIGYFVQPMYDFRPYPIGSSLSSDIGDTDVKLIYEKDGVQKSFSIDNLPSKDWIYVGREQSNAKGHAQLTAFDGDEDVTADIFESEGPQILLVVTNPDKHNRARASMANNTNRYITANGGSMVGLIALPPQSMETWKSLTNPDYEVYSVDDTSLKELVRGDAALVYLESGVIKWKRNIYSLPGNFPDFSDHDILDNVFAPDSGKPLERLTILYLIFIALPCILRIPFLNRKKKTIQQ